jgi:ferric-dicitrate binding protein FerR (iron transport regulator)
MVGVGGGLLWQRVRERTSAGADAVAARVLQTGRAQRATYRLADGTTVTLAPESELRLPPDFDRRTRDVWLRGAASFEVEPAREKPFIVHTSEALTQVIGTHFGVRSYADEPDVEVVVSHGAVALRLASDSASAGVTLGPGQLGRVTASGRLEVVNGVDASRMLQWTSGKLSFESASLRTVAKELERWYGLTVAVPDSALAARRVSATLPLEPPLGRILDMFAISLDVVVERNGDSVTFRPR